MTNNTDDTFIRLAPGIYQRIEVVTRSGFISSIPVRFRPGGASLFVDRTRIVGTDEVMDLATPNQPKPESADGV